jgi:hypothetical protein
MWAGMAFGLLSVSRWAGSGAERPSRSWGNAEAEVRALGARYYDAFRLGRIEDACRYVAERTLDSQQVVSFNIRKGDKPKIKPERPATGCALVRRRRSRWQEPLPRSAWHIEAVHLDAVAERARVDTNGEGTYWMRKTRAGWRIVGFGMLTRAGFRELGGDWPPGAVSE